MAAVALAAPAAVRPALAVQITILVAAVAIFGVPHGALDPLVGRRWLAPRLGPRWWAPFHGGYLLLAMLVVVGWILIPAATLVAFLAGSALHFGLGDVARGRAPHRLAWAEVLARGAAPITVPALAHPETVRQAFAWVAPAADNGTVVAIVAASAWCARWLVVPGCALFALAHLVAARRLVRVLGVHAGEHEPEGDPVGGLDGAAAHAPGAVDEFSTRSSAMAASKSSSDVKLWYTLANRR